MPLLKTPPRWVVYLLSFSIVSLSLFTLFGERGVLHLWHLRDEKVKLDEKNYLLQKENESLRERISRLRNDDFYLEKLAREELNLVRSGEIIYRFPASEPKSGRSRAFSGPRSGSPPSAARTEPR